MCAVPQQPVQVVFQYPLFAVWAAAVGRSVQHNAGVAVAAFGFAPRVAPQPPASGTAGTVPGIFTRRAVKLLEPSEAKAIVAVPLLLPAVAVLAAPKPTTSDVLSVPPAAKTLNEPAAEASPVVPLKLAFRPSENPSLVAVFPLNVQYVHRVINHLFSHLGIFS